jgi:hypothetical protein
VTLLEFGQTLLWIVGTEALTLLGGWLVVLLMRRISVKRS